jgi:hypothetical protein
VNIILDGCSTLEERFAKIDSNMVLEKLKIEQKKQQRISPAMKKIGLGSNFAHSPLSC